MTQDDGVGFTIHVRVILRNTGYSNVLVDPLTGVPAGLLTIVTVNWLSTPEKHHNNNYELTV